MRKLLALGALLVVTACQQNVIVPTSQELIAKPQLYAEWEAKCNTGEYSHLPAAEKDNMCFTTHEAGRSLAAVKAGKEGDDFYRANTVRK